MTAYTLDVTGPVPVPPPEDEDWPDDAEPGHGLAKVTDAGFLLALAFTALDDRILADEALEGVEQGAALGGADLRAAGRAKSKTDMTGSQHGLQAAGPRGSQSANEQPESVSEVDRAGAAAAGPGSSRARATRRGPGPAPSCTGRRPW